jgi:hypothetical protein
VASGSPWRTWGPRTATLPPRACSSRLRRQIKTALRFSPPDLGPPVVPCQYRADCAPQLDVAPAPATGCARPLVVVQGAASTYRDPGRVRGSCQQRGCHTDPATPHTLRNIPRPTARAHPQAARRGPSLAGARSDGFTRCSLAGGPSFE